MLGNAMFTIVASRNAMKAASEQTTRTARSLPAGMGDEWVSPCSDRTGKRGTADGTAPPDAVAERLLSRSARALTSDRGGLRQPDLAGQPLGRVRPARHDRRALHVRRAQ